MHSALCAGAEPLHMLGERSTGDCHPPLGFWPFLGREERERGTLMGTGQAVSLAIELTKVSEMAH